MLHSQLPMSATSCASASEALALASRCSAVSRSDRTAPRIIKLTVTAASSPSRISTVSVGVWCPKGTFPRTAPATAITAQRKLAVTAPSWRKRRAAQISNGNRTVR